MSHDTEFNLSVPTMLGEILARDARIKQLKAALADAHVTVPAYTGGRGATVLDDTPLEILTQTIVELSTFDTLNDLGLHLHEHAGQRTLTALPGSTVVPRTP